jgi:hypothetical protein
MFTASALMRLCRILAMGGTGGFIILGLLCFAAGGRFNASHRIPPGLYWLTDSDEKR